MSFNPRPKPFANAADWAQRLKKHSAKFAEYDAALNSNVSLQTQNIFKTLVNTEGTQVEQGKQFTRLLVTARGKASDGMDVVAMESIDTDDPAKLPQDAEISALVDKVGKTLTTLVRAASADVYTGPAIFSGRAAGVFLHEILGHRIEGHRTKDASEGQTFTQSLNTQVLPEFLSVAYDPSQAQFQGVGLHGSFLYDDEGVKSRRVQVVENGILKTFLTSRSPIVNVAQSNGHGRRAPGNEVLSRQSTMFVDSSKKLSDTELRRMLIEEVRRQNKPYGLFFDQVVATFNNTARSALQAFTVTPLRVYKVYADGRPDEPVRGAEIAGTPLTALSKILATSDKLDVYNGFCGAESGDVAVSVVSPALLVKEIEVQRKARSTDRPPFLARPSGDGQ